MGNVEAFLWHWVPTLLLCGIIVHYIWEGEDNRWKAGVVIVLTFILIGFEQAERESDHRCDRVKDVIERVEEDHPELDLDKGECTDDEHWEGLGIFG